MGIRIITDSVADIPKNIVEELDIEVLPLIVNFEDASYKDGIEISSKEFFDKLEKSNKLPSTSQVSPGEFIRVFQRARECEDEVIAILMSSKLSGTFNSAMTARDFVDEAGITVIDSKAVTFGQGMIVIEAARMAQKGLSRKEITDRILYMTENMVNKFLVDNLEYLKKGGRLSPSQAMVGKLLNIKPILTMKDGVLVLEDKVRGRKKGLKWIVNWIVENNCDLSQKTVGLFHSNDYEGLELLKEYITGSMDCGEIIESEVGAVVGTHAGPGCIAIAFMKN